MSEVPKPTPPKHPLSIVPPVTAARTRVFTRSSKCTNPRTTAMDWIYYRGNDGNVADEIKAVVGALPLAEQEMVAAEMDAIVDAAAEGKLEDGEPLQPLSINPELWELRFVVQSKLYRLYFAEPYTHPDHLVALRFHEKVIYPTQQQIDDTQAAEIATAALRFKAGSPNEWGMAA